VKPSNQIVAYGDPLGVEMEIGANATEAKMLAGRVVIFDDIDQTVKEAGAKATNVVGFLEVDPAKKKTDNYEVSDQAKVNAYTLIRGSLKLCDLCWLAESSFQYLLCRMPAS